ncbi:sigma-70 family RNA polymerase sigma factor [Curtobacterium flaccumfaciens]|uniref:sigma-70 family RNA polymerase sigma factor n=1 Tax=Curtobacterium flaccumfaciens TaxID=2035 RepID=UPI001BDDEBC2|nr:sigma-70 family RNA polymerase sigma factor [Curtobacterium flaccumfaciens]MBT1671935.1 RNA polymerase sigma factor [Curtobacterium flaccumfaciens pv. flaccumfaciens]
MQRSDAALIAAARDGDNDAIGVLWKRHAPAALRLARGQSSASDADDLVAEAFTRIIKTLRGGAGPTELFRPYLYTVIKNLTVREQQRDTRFSDADTDFDQLETDDEADPADMVARELNRHILGRAFTTLPERWQAVLWYLEVEAMKPREVAPLVGLNAGAVSSLAYRARRALRGAWVQEHIDLDAVPAECRPVLADFGAYEAGTLSTRGRKRFEQHVRDCESCPDFLAQSRREVTNFAAVLLPLIAGTTAAHLVNSSASGTVAANAAGVRTTVRHGRRTGTVVAAAAGVAVLGAAAFASTMSTTSHVQPRATDSTRSTDTAPNQPRAETDSRGGGSRPAERSAPETSPSATATPVLPGRRSDNAFPGEFPNAPGGTPRSVRSEPLDVNAAGDQDAPGARQGPTPGPHPRPRPDPDPDPTPVPQPLAAPIPDNEHEASPGRTVPLSGRGEAGTTVTATAPQAAPSVKTEVDADGRWSVTMEFAADGLHEVQLTAGAAGRSPSRAAVVRVLVDTQAPAPPTLIVSWADTAVAPPVFEGTAEPHSRVEARTSDGAVSTSTITRADGTWQLTVLTLPPTTDRLEFTATDAVGNTSEKTTSPALAFRPTFTGPSPDAVLPEEPIPVRIQGWPGSTVTVWLDGRPLGTLTLDAAGTARGFVGTGEGSSLAPGSYELGVSYTAGIAPLSSAPRTTIQVTIG